MKRHAILLVMLVLLSVGTVRAQSIIHTGASGHISFTINDACRLGARTERNPERSQVTIYHFDCNSHYFIIDLVNQVNDGRSNEHMLVQEAAHSVLTERKLKIGLTPELKAGSPKIGFAVLQRVMTDWRVGARLNTEMIDGKRFACFATRGKTAIDERGQVQVFFAAEVCAHSEHGQDFLLTVVTLFNNVNDGWIDDLNNFHDSIKIYR